MINGLVFIAVVILILWLLGLIFSFNGGPILWILFVIGLILLIVWLVQRVRTRRYWYSS